MSESNVSRAMRTWNLRAAGPESSDDQKTEAAVLKALATQKPQTGAKLIFLRRCYVQLGEKRKALEATSPPVQHVQNAPLKKARILSFC